MRTRFLSSLGCLSLLAVACGGNVETPPGSGGSGGAAASSTGSTSSGGGGGTGGSAPVFCGGFAGVMCGATEFCDWVDGSCGGDDGQGVCTPRPDVCPDDCPGVCGCDGMLYCNECMAQAAGVDTSALGSCTGNAQYSAYFWAGGLDHLQVRKADFQANRCTIVYADAPTQNAPGFNITIPMGWGVNNAIITDQASDCALPPGPMMGQVVNATGAVGSLDWVVQPGMYAPCDLLVLLTLDFAGAPAWVPLTDTLNANMVTVDGGCM